MRKRWTNGGSGGGEGRKSKLHQSVLLDITLYYYGWTQRDRVILTYTLFFLFYFYSSWSGFCIAFINILITHTFVSLPARHFVHRRFDVRAFFFQPKHIHLNFMIVFSIFCSPTVSSSPIRLFYVRFSLCVLIDDIKCSRADHWMELKQMAEIAWKIAHLRLLFWWNNLVCWSHSIVLICCWMPQQLKEVVNIVNGWIQPQIHEHCPLDEYNWNWRRKYSILPRLNSTLFQWFESMTSALCFDSFEYRLAVIERIPDFQSQIQKKRRR